MYYINVRGIGSFITLFATEVGIADISLFFLFNALAIAVTRPFSGKLYDAKGHSFVIIPGVIITFYRDYFIVVYNYHSKLNYCSSMLRKWFRSDSTCTTSVDDWPSSTAPTRSRNSYILLSIWPWNWCWRDYFWIHCTFYKLRNCISLFLSTTYCFPVHLHYKCKNKSMVIKIRKKLLDNSSGFLRILSL